MTRWKAEAHSRVRRQCAADVTQLALDRFARPGVRTCDGAPKHTHADFADNGLSHADVDANAVPFTAQ
jgi:hypothetical protein